MQGCVLQLWHGQTIWAGDLHNVGLPKWLMMFTVMVCFYAHDEARRFSYNWSLSQHLSSSMNHSIRSSCSWSLLKQQWGGIKWSSEITSSEYMNGDRYFKYCRRLQLLQYTEIPKVIKYQHHGRKRKCNTCDLEFGAANARKQYEAWGSREQLPCSWEFTPSCSLMLAMTAHKTVFSRPSFYLEILRLGLSFFLFPLFFSVTLH